MDKIENIDKLLHLKFGEVMHCLCEARVAIIKLKPLIDVSSEDKARTLFEQFERNIEKFERDFVRLFDRLVLKK